MMKFFRKKSPRPPASHTGKTGSNPPQSFYSQYAGEAPLDEYSDVRGPQPAHRTSRHSVAYRRELSNRASSWALALLLLRAVLIVLLLVGGFIVLKLVLNHMSKPSEKEQQQWEVNAVRMEKSSSSVASSAEQSIPQELVASAALIEQRLGQWEQTERLFRSAEALNRRGINDEAARLLEQTLRIAPDNRAARQLLADIYMHLGLYAEAVPLYLRLLDQESRNEEFQMNLLRALQESGQLDAGLVLANRMLLDQPNNLAVLSIAAAGEVQQGNPAAALVLFERMLENSETNLVALAGCGRIYAAQNECEKAVPYYLELVRLDPSPEHYQMLALCYARQNQAGKAVVFMGQAASLFGGGTVSAWLRDPVLDPIRESVEFRSFADRIVGIQTRKAIEAISLREAEKEAAKMPGEFELPQQPDLNLNRSTK
jgi:tetratricopeptide (TPR) repeat protein